MSEQNQGYATPLTKDDLEGLEQDPKNGSMQKSKRISSGDKPAAAIGIANKEALYCAVGRCCQKLKGEIPVEDWVNRILIVEVQLPPNDHLLELSPSFSFIFEAYYDRSVYILQRRIAWVLGK
ncbi:hypothetical protein HHX47_DHR5000773 [Lentinula edodes]|nr:hypothetical protein HHX47_DHR5000773 [Lentinula edodes]